MRVYYIARSSNRKTGDLVQQYIGKNLEESRKSCQGCKLLEDRTCYSTFGTPAMSFSSIEKAYKVNSNKYTIKNALKNRKGDSKYVRFGAIGDPASIRRDSLLHAKKQIKKAGLGILAYTHFWRTRGKDLKNLCFASCDTIKDVFDAFKKGWKSTLIVESFDKWGKKGVLNGIRYAACPAQYKKDVTCNSCGLCSLDKKHNIDLILFEKH